MESHLNTYPLRAIEIHSHVWDQAAVLRAIDFARKNQMNALILHANDIVDEVVWPASYFGAAEGRHTLYENYSYIFKTIYQQSARRRYMPIHRRDFLKWTIQMAAKHGIAVYLENKELWFPDDLQDMYPQLRKTGPLCCSDPLWWEFLETKYRELMADLPGLSGIMTSPGSRESRLTIGGNRCTCPTCQEQSPSEWYFQLIMSLYKPISEAGKTLIVRDFVFDKATQTSLSSAMDRLPKDVILSLKNTPHDFYPTFPDNPKIGETKSHPFWVEYDAMGQYYGWGIGIADLVEEMQRRLRHGLENGASGIVARTDWEGLPNHSCFDTPNLVNLYAAALFASEIDTDPRNVYLRWLQEENILADHGDPDACVEWIVAVMGKTWNIVKRTIFMNDCVFSDSSCFPVSLDHAFWLGEEKNSLRDWVKDKQDALEPTEENVALILREKEEAVQLFKELEEEVYRGNPGLTVEAEAKLKTQIDMFGLYVEGFSLIGKTAIVARTLLQNEEENHRNQLNQLMDSLLDYAKKLENRSKEESWPFAVQAILNPERIYVFHSDIKSKVVK